MDAAGPHPHLDRYYAAPQMMAKVNRRRRINLVITGEGSPTVILAPGHGCTTLEWSPVQIGLGISARAVSFDQAGMGFSDPGPLPVTASAVVEDLRAALKAADIGPPYVLAGWSIGGLYMRLFAFRYPEDVVGMVMVDSSTEYQDRRMWGEDHPQFVAMMRSELRKLTRLTRLAREGRLARDVPDYGEMVRAVEAATTVTPAVKASLIRQLTSTARWRAMRSEMASTWTRSFDEVASARKPLGDMPLIVLTAGRMEELPGETPEAAQRMEDAVRVMHEETAALSTRGQRRTIDAGHAIQIEKPEAVVAAIEEVLATVRSESANRSGRN